jgi:sn-glycerol 3-phosphate transport system substrate-binding protein
MKILQRRSTIVPAALLLAAAIGACGGTSDRATSGGAGDDLSEIACPLSALPESGPAVKISLWYGNQQGKNKEVMEKLARSYNASQDRVEVTAADQGQDYQAMLGKYTQAIQDGRIPNVLFADATHAQFLVDSGTLVPGGACAQQGVVPLEHIYPVVRSFYTRDGAYIPGSVNLTSTMIYYNKVAYADAGLPQKTPATLDELRSQAEKIATAGIPDMKWPVSMVVAPGFFNAELTGIGQDIVDHDNGRDGHATAAVFDTPRTVAFMRSLQALYADGLIAKVSNTPGQIDQYLNVAQGKSAMVIETSAAATTVEAFLGGGMSAAELADGGLGGLSGDAKVVPGFGEMPGIAEPGQVPVIGGAYYVTNGGTRAQQAAAMDFIRYLNELPQLIEWLIEGSYLSANDRVAGQPKVKKFFADSVAGLALKLASDQVAAVPAERAGPVVGPFDQYEKIIQSMMESVLLDGADPAKAVRSAEAEVTAALRSYNDENGF